MLQYSDAQRQVCFFPLLHLGEHGKRRKVDKRPKTDQESTNLDQYLAESNQARRNGLLGSYARKTLWRVGHATVNYLRQNVYEARWLACSGQFSF